MAASRNNNKKFVSGKMITNQGVELSEYKSMNFSDISKRYYALELALNLYKCFSTDLSEMKSVFEHSKYPHCYEIVTPDRPVREFYDIDFDVVDEMFISKTSDTLVSQLVDRFLIGRNAIANNKLYQRDFAIAYRISVKSDGEQKLGIRFWSLKTYFTSMQQHKKFAKELYAVNNIPGFDAGIYSKNRLMNLFGSSKFKNGIPLLAHPNGSFTEEDTLIILSNIDTFECCDLDAPDIIPTRIINNTVSENTSTTLPASIQLFLKDHPEFTADETDTNRLKRLYPSKCVLKHSSDVIHDRDHVLWIETEDGDFLLVCPRCPKTPAKKLPQIIDIQPELGASEKINWNTIQINDLYIDKITDRTDVNAIKKYDLMVLTSPLGSGKTQSVMQFTAPYSKVLFITHRISLAKDVFEKYATDYGFEYYTNFNWKANKLIVVVNSLMHIPDVLAYDVVIVDELGGLFMHTTSSNFPPTSLSQLALILTKHPRLICMDGTLSNGDLDLLVEYSKPLNPIKFDYIFERQEAPRRCFKYPTKDCIAFLINDALDAGENIILAFSCSTNSIKSFIQCTKIADVSHLIIHKHNKSDVVLDHKHWETFRVLVYSPTIAEGVSYTGTHFTSVFGVFSKLSCGPRTAVQMLGRCRSACNFYIHVSQRMLPSTFATFGSSLFTLIRTVVGPEVLKTKFGFALDLYRKQIKEQAEENAEYDKYMDIYLAKNKYEITTLEKAPSDPAFSSKFKTASEEVERIHNQAITDAEDIDDRTFQRLVKSCETEEDAYKVTKYKLKKDLILNELKPEHWEYFRHSSVIKYTRMLFHPIVNEQGDQVIDPEAVLNQMRDSNTERFRTANEFGEQRECIKLYTSKKLLAIWAIQGAGFSNVFDTRAIPDLNEFFTWCKSMKRCYTLAKLSGVQFAALKTELDKNVPGKHTRQAFTNVIDHLFLELKRNGNGFVLRTKMQLSTDPADDRYPLFLHAESFNTNNKHYIEAFVNRTDIPIPGRAICPRCQAEMRVDNLERHLVACRGLLSIEDKPEAYCPKCGKSTQYGNIARHLKTCKEDKPTKPKNTCKCQYCEKEMRADNLERHTEKCKSKRIGCETVRIVFID